MLRVEGVEQLLEMLRGNRHVTLSVETAQVLHQVAGHFHRLAGAVGKALRQITGDGFGVEAVVILILTGGKSVRIFHAGARHCVEALHRLGHLLREGGQHALIRVDGILELVLVVEHVRRLELLLGHFLTLLRRDVGGHLEAEGIELGGDALAVRHGFRRPGEGGILDVDVRQVVERLDVRIGAAVFFLDALRFHLDGGGMLEDFAAFRHQEDARLVAGFRHRGKVGVILTVGFALLTELLIDVEQLLAIIFEELLGFVQIAFRDFQVREERHCAAEPEVLLPEQSFHHLARIGEILVLLRLVRRGFAELHKELGVLVLHLALHVRRHRLDGQQVAVRRLGTLVILQEDKHLGILVGGLKVKLLDALRRVAFVFGKETLVDIQRVVVAVARIQIIGQRGPHGPDFRRILVGLGLDDFLRFIELAEHENLLELLHLDERAGGRELRFYGTEDFFRVIRHLGIVQKLDITEFRKELGIIGGAQTLSVRHPGSEPQNCRHGQGSAPNDCVTVEHDYS